MSNAVTDGGIYANGRTHAEHCAWLDSLQPDSDEYRIVYMPRGHLFNLADVSYLKYALLTVKMTSGERSKTLDAIAIAVLGPVTWEAIAAIEPCCDTGREILEEIKSLDVDEQSRAFNNGDVFRLLAKLNPSLLRALEFCTCYRPTA
jgi:hypothetical protein